MFRLDIRTFLSIILLAALGLTLTACDTTDTSDYYGPRVLSTNPSYGATNVAVGNSITVTFNESILASSVTSESFIVKQVSTSLANVTGSISVGNNVVVFTPTYPFEPEATYLVTLVSTITDDLINFMVNNYSWFFTTGVDAGALGTFDPASIVVGQGVFTSSAPGLTNVAVSAPAGTPFINGSTLYLPDTANNRVLGFNTIPVTNGVAADFVLGQTDFTSGAPGNSPDALNAPGAVYVYGGKTFVADTGNNRVLIWNTVAVSNAAAADIALGQPDLHENSPGCSAYLMNSPTGLSVAGGSLVVSDTLNNRVLVWNAIPTLSNTAADMVIGNDIFNSCAAGSPVSGETMNTPGGLWSDGARLAVADTGNNRVLIWNDFPSVSNALANTVIGQPDMTANNSYVSAVDMSAPAGLAVSADNKLYVADRGNNRVMVWYRFPYSNYLQADAVLGQTVFYSSGCGITANTLCGPSGAFASGAGSVLVSDTANNRVLIYNTP